MTSFGPVEGASGKLGRIELSGEVPVTATDIRKGFANNSPMLAADPTDPRFVVLANRLDAPTFGCGLELSGDRGRSWTRAKPVRRLPTGADKCYAPEIDFDDKGTLYYLFLGLRGRGNEPIGAFLTRSTDRGRSFTPPRRVLGPERYMVRMGIDRRDDRIYLAWLEASSDPPLGGLPAPPNPIKLAFSTDGGATFSSPVRVNDVKRPLSVAPALAVGPDGAVHVAYYDLRDDTRDYHGLEGPVWEGNWTLALASSTNGGRSFMHTQIDAQVRPPDRVMLIFTMPPASVGAGPGGRVYAAWPDSRSGDSDVLIKRSADGGRTWRNPAVRLNDDPPGKPVWQGLPKLGVSADGRLDAIFYDRRNDPENVRQDLYFTYSADHARTFSPNLRVTRQSSHSKVGQVYLVPSAAGKYEPGGRLALSPSKNSSLAAWTDTRNSLTGGKEQDIFARTISFDR